MKKLKLLWLGLFVSLFANSQAGQINQINIVSFNVKNILPGTVDSWMSTPAALILVAQKVPSSVPLREPRLVVQIRSGGAVICGNNMATGKQVDPFDVRTFNTADLTGILSNCHELKEGSYSICVQFFNIDKVAISREVCKEFRVEAPVTDYSPPTLITPDNGKKFTQQELMGLVMFRWTPLVPKPRDPVTYRLRVWQLMQGQNGTTAMRTNQPIVTKDVDNLTQAAVTSVITGPCKPPYLCDFIWNVQAIGKDGKPLGRNNGLSEAYTFSATETTKCPNNVFPEDKKQFTLTEAKGAVIFKWSPVAPNPGETTTYRLKVWQLMQGQSPQTAMKSNQPVVTKEVSNTSEVSVAGVITGPCKPPYMCDFIWAVEMVGRDGRTTCTTEPTTFSVKTDSVKCPNNVFPEDKKQFSLTEAKGAIAFKWTAATPGTATTYRLKVWQLMQGQSPSQAMRSNKPIIEKDVRDATEYAAANLYTGPCKPPYMCDYIWAVEMMGSDGHTTCTTEPTTFSVKTEATTCPSNLFPGDKKQFDLNEAKRAITFKWTQPVPGESPTYRLKVWQLMQGQNGTQAMKSNSPLITRDVKNATEATINGIITGPCKPPYLCDFIWAVERMGADGKVICTSEPTMFAVTQYIIQIDSIKVLCTSKPGVYSFSYTITNVNPGTATLTNFAITSSVPAGAGFGAYAPPIGTSIPSGNQLTITGTINAATNLSNICIGAEITDAANNFWKASKDTCVKVKPCRCDACDEKNFTFNAPVPANISVKNGAISFNQPITITAPGKTVTAIKAELVYFEMVPENDMCIPCNKDAAAYGHFTNGTNSLEWNKPIPQQLNINLTTPLLTPCCSALFKWCIRYKVEMKDSKGICYTCNVLVCYEKKKEGCMPVGGGTDNPNTNTPK